MVYRRYRRKRYREYKLKRKRKLRGQGMFIDILKNLGTAWYCAWDGKWEEIKLCYGKICDA